ncbi:glutamate--tRNA ligase [Candidatus Leptofilum sp.]|uniref:glutamate--tRNA ligase n=1 Tax=Candidatus Leptofilum sp. TaxID=3241576 RepID=UPI003B5C3DC1
MVPRLRFPPSPTGPIHVGNMHTAVFCWALSRALKGDFILRIEDTDAARNTPEATQLIFDALNWLGLDWDEGPDIGGDFGPYVQSERRPFHQRTIEKLVDEGHAYYGDDPANPATPSGNPLRLRMPRAGETTLHDAIRGEIRFENGRNQDPIIVRSNGDPLYHLATVTDDHDMGITHVVRGEDWIPSAPIHIQLHKAMGWDEPVWVHLPLILNRQGQKLKKRDPEGGYLIRDFQAAGYLPQALFNYLLLLGWTPDNAQEIVDKWDVRQQFRLERLSPSPSTFDWDKLNWMNRQYMQRFSHEKLAELLRPYLEDVYDELPLQNEWLVRLTAVIRESLNKLEDAVDAAEWAFADNFELTPGAQEALHGESARPVLTRLVAELAHVVLLDEATAQSILQGLRNGFKESDGWQPTAIFHPIRAALTGQTGGPPLAEIMAILGKNRTLQRIANALRL